MVKAMTVAVLALVLGLGIWAADGAAAPLTVAQAILAQDRIFTSSPGYKLLSDFKVKSAAQARVAIPQLEHTRKLLEVAARVVAHTPATTTPERAGRADWVAGARLVATGIGDLASGLTDLVAGHRSAADRALKLSVSDDKQGAILAARGDRLLGLPATD